MYVDLIWRYLIIFLFALLNNFHFDPIYVCETSVRLSWDYSETFARLYWDSSETIVRLYWDSRETDYRETNSKTIYKESETIVRLIYEEHLLLLDLQKKTNPRLYGFNVHSSSCSVGLFSMYSIHSFHSFIL